MMMMRMMMMSKGKGIPEYDDDPTHHHLACAPAGFFAMPPRAAELPIRRWNGAGNRRRAWALQGFILWAQALRRARAPRAWRRLAARLLEHERLVQRAAWLLVLFLARANRMRFIL